MADQSKWAGRFVAAAIIQGVIAFVIMSILVGISVLGVLGVVGLGPSPGRIVAGGDSCTVRITNNVTMTGTATCSNASNWFIVGMIGYALVGVLGISVSALFYQYLESTLGAPYSGWRDLTAWLHLVLGGAGSSAAALIAAYGGYLGGAALLPVSSGGGGQNAGYVHTNILNPLSMPITVLMALGLLGFLLGGLGYVTAWWAVRKKGKAAE
jgi:hypothetical protein